MSEREPSQEFQPPIEFFKAFEELSHGILDDQPWFETVDEYLGQNEDHWTPLEKEQSFNFPSGENTKGAAILRQDMMIVEEPGMPQNVYTGIYHSLKVHLPKQDDDAVMRYYLRFWIKNNDEGRIVEFYKDEYEADARLKPLKEQHLIRINDTLLEIVKEPIGPEDADLFMDILSSYPNLKSEK